MSNLSLTKNTPPKTTPLKREANQNNQNTKQAIKKKTTESHQPICPPVTSLANEPHIKVEQVLSDLEQVLSTELSEQLTRFKTDKNQDKQVLVDTIYPIRCYRQEKEINSICIENLDLSALFLEGLDLSQLGLIFDNVNFSNATFIDCDLSGATFINCRLNATNIVNSWAIDVECQNCSFKDARIKNSNLSKSGFIDCDLSELRDHNDCMLDSIDIL